MRIGDRGTAAQVLNEATNRGIMGTSGIFDAAGARAAGAMDSAGRIFGVSSLF